MRIGIKLFFLTTLILCVGIESSYAYSPPPSFILRSWVNRRGNANNTKKIKIRSLVTLSEKGKSTSERFKDLTVVVDGQLLRSWALDETDHVLYFQEKALSTSSLTAKLLLSSSSSELLRALKEAGFTELVTLVRWKGSVAWAIGQKPLKKENLQLWMEKESFIPMRMMIPESPGHAGVSLSFDNFRRDTPFPRLITVADSGDDSQGSQMSSQLLDLAVNSEFTKLPKIATSGFTSAGEASSALLKSAIRRYYELLR